MLLARRRIQPHLRPTALHEYAPLNELLQATVYVKHENHLPTGAFKVRGGINLVSQLDPEERERGIIGASTGNHGQSLAYAGRLFGVRTIICAPAAANPVKVASMRGLGAELILEGDRYDDAREHCEALAHEHGYRYVHSGNEPLLIAGVATHTLEVLEERPEVEVLLVPIGGGSGAAGACLAAAALKPGLEVIGVQSASAPAAYRSWKQGRLTEAPNTTFAEGLATATAFELPQRILRQHLKDFVLVSDEELAQATRLMIEHTRNLVEPAAAAPLAGALQIKPSLQGRTVALICSGGNLSPAQLLQLFRDS
ncbi:MAG TPA: pyridoxal-phosphate dependent enzyme [Candidatus Acidoferrales bacterium]|nr:pyridoxal-phosphate dependent enzyme [Candidatus Acidoferrales bacterium]